MSDAPLQPLIDKFWETVPPAWHRTRAVIRGVAAEKFNLTVEQFQVLRRIRRGIDSVSAIAADSRTSPSTVSRAVEALVGKGLVRRGQNPSDRRHLPLTLTDEGQRVMTAIFDETEVWLAKRFARLSAEEADLLLRALPLLHKAFIS